MRIVPTLAFVWTLLGGVATTAQYSSGDILVMASQQGRPLVLGITQSGTVFTASPTAPVAGYSEILPSADNRTTWFAAAGRGLFALSPSGQWSTVTATMPGVALNVDGTGMLLAAGFGGTIYGYDVRGTQYTLAAYPSNFSFHGLLYDPRSGDILWDVGSAFLSVSPFRRVLRQSSHRRDPSSADSRSGLQRPIPRSGGACRAS